MAISTQVIIVLSLAIALCGLQCVQPANGEASCMCPDDNGVATNDCEAVFARNDDGSGRCCCCSGYEVVQADDLTWSCSDIDECSSQNGGCQHNCTNTNGAHTCSCVEGYQLDSNNMSCTEITNCLGERHSCPPGRQCVGRGGNYSCSENCSEGYRLEQSGSCTHEASCMCPDENGVAIKDCETVFARSDDGSGRCCCCSGYEVVQADDLTWNCSDIDECSSQNGGCQHNCTNTNGSHTCSCVEGFQLDSNNMSCTEITNCLGERRSCPPGKQCVERGGSYSCSENCSEGYRLEQSGSCTHEVDLCVRGNRSCCSTVSIGSAGCLCKEGEDGCSSVPAVTGGTDPRDSTGSTQISGLPIGVAIAAALLLLAVVMVTLSVLVWASRGRQRKQSLVTRTDDIGTYDNVAYQHHDAGLHFLASDESQASVNPDPTYEEPQDS